MAPAHVVVRVRNDDGFGGIHDTVYKYGRGRAHRLDGSQGFGWMQVHDVLRSAYAQTAFAQSFPFTGMPVETGSYVLRPALNAYRKVAESVSVYATKNLNSSSLSRFLYAASSLQKTWEYNDGVQTSATLTTVAADKIDAYGNVLELSVADTLGGYEKLTTSAYFAADVETAPSATSFTGWRLGRLATATVKSTAPGAAAYDADLNAALTNLERKSAFTYHPTTGLLLSETVEPDAADSRRLATTYDYDAAGNKTKVTLTGTGLTDAAGNAAGRTTETLYDANGRFPLWTKNALNQQESYGYDANLGVLRELTGPNQLTTRWEYDGFGRKTAELRPDGAGNTAAASAGGSANRTLSTYGWVSPAEWNTGLRYFVHTQADGAPPTLTRHDRLGRAVLAYGINGGAYNALASLRVVAVKTDYDAVGRVVQTSRPYFVANEQPQPTATIAYDELDRPKSCNIYDDAVAGGYYTVTHSYTAFTATLSTPRTDGVTLVATATRNSQGWTIESGANATAAAGATAGRVTHAYDALGNLRRTRTWVDNNTSAKIDLVYDIRGRKTQMTDPDMGTWNYGYNAAGELTSQTSARAQTTVLRYDQLGRLVRREEPEGATTWTYDTAAKGVGKPAGVSAPGYSESYTYDAAGRAYTQTRTILGTAFTTSQLYDAYGRPEKTVYPGAYQVKNVYNGLGFLREVRDARPANTSLLNDTSAGMMYWQADAYDRWGGVAGSQLGNGISYDRVTSGVTGRVSAITGYVLRDAGSKYVQSHAYIYDNFGQVTLRQDGVLNRTEAFTYDGLNRLKNHNNYNILASAFTYDALGNITGKTGVGLYSYGPGGSMTDKPHANRGGSAGYAYDADGNMQNGRNGQAYQWTSANQLRRIDQGSVWAEFGFGAGRERVTQKKSDGTTIIYAGAGYEEVRRTSDNVPIERRYYILTPLGRTATRVERVQEAKVETRWFHQDALGSVVAISDEWGRIERRYAYDAWGVRTTIQNSGGLNTLNRAYTDHELLEDFGLIHMNGRVFDPTLGRFLSADPFVDNAYDSQAYNRYSYVGNNPLNHTDPSGYFKLSFKTILKIVAVVVIAYFTAGAAIGAFGTTMTGSMATGFTVTAGSTFATMMPVAIGNGIIGGLAGGFASGFAGSLLNGGSIGDAFKSGAIGGVAGAVGGGIAGAFSEAGLLTRTVAASAVGGATSEAMGGSFRDGALMAGAVTLANYGFQRARDFTDDHAEKAARTAEANGDQKVADQLRVTDPFGNRRTDGGITTEDGKVWGPKWLNKAFAPIRDFLGGRGMAGQGSGDHFYDHAKWTGGQDGWMSRHINQVSKLHDWFNGSRGYNHFSGNYVSHGAIYDSVFTMFSFS